MAGAARARDEGGFALASTIGILGVVTLLVIALTSATINVTRQARREVGYSAALGAAEAGVQDFLYRLNSEPDYWRRIPSADEVASPNPNRDTTNAAFTSFVPVSGATNGAAYTYTVEQFIEVAPPEVPEGRIVVTSTGAVGGVTRTIRVTLERETFLDYAYAADKGTLDPELYTSWPPNLFDGDGNNDRDSTQPADFRVGPDAVTVAKEQCGKYWRYSATRPLNDPTDRGGDTRAPYAGRHPDCHEFQFNGAVFDGPFHFNDVIVLRGDSSTWRSTATTSYGNGANPPQVPAPPYRQLNTGGQVPTPVFGDPPGTGRLEYRRPIEFPPNNRELRDTAALPRPGGGYVFTGPTRIVMLDDQIYVDSPRSSGRYSGMSAGGQGYLPLPPNGVVYVENAPAGCPAGWRPPLGGITGSLEVQDYLSAMYPAYPSTSQNDDITEYNCTAGDAYVQGELLGRLTIGAQNDVVVTWHIGYDSSPTAGTPSGYAGTPPTTDRDVLGLVADGQIRVFKPTRCVYRLRLLVNGQETNVCEHGYNIPFHSAGGALRTINDLTIYGALLTTQRALNVANATMGGRIGTLTVVGTLTERFASYTGTPATSGGVGGGHAVPRNAAEIPDNCADPVVPGSIVARDGNAGNLAANPPRQPTGSCSTVGGLFKRFVYDDRVQYIEPPSFLSPDSVSWNQERFEERARPADLPPVPAPSPAPTASP